MSVKYCCGCLPLRNGLIIWGYFSLIMMYFSALVTLYRLQDLMYGPKDLYGSNDFFFLFISLVGILMHFIFNVVLVAGLHTKSCCMLEVYNGYLVISMVVEGMVSGLYIPLAMISLYRSDYKESLIIWMSLYYAAIVIAVSDLIFKYYILICVRSLISILGSKEEEYQSECTEVLVLDNTKRRRRDARIQVGGNDDFTRIVHDNTNNTIDDNLQPVGNFINVNNNSRNMEENDNSQSVVNSDVTVHNDPKYNTDKDDSKPVGNF